MVGENYRWKQRPVVSQSWSPNLRVFKVIFWQNSCKDDNGSINKDIYIMGKIGKKKRKQEKKELIHGKCQMIKEEKEKKVKYIETILSMNFKFCWAQKGTRGPVLDGNPAVAGGPTYTWHEGLIIWCGIVAIIANWYSTMLAAGKTKKKRKRKLFLLFQKNC